MTAQPAGDEAELFTDRYSLVQVDGLDARISGPGEGAHRQPGQLLGGDGGHELGKQRRQMWFQGDDAGVAACRGLRPVAEGRCDLLEGPVLQEPGEEQVTGLEQLEVGLLLVLVVGQKAVGLERQEGGGHDDELRCAPQVPVRAHVGDEVVGHLGQRQLGDVKPLAGDETQ